MSTIYFPPLTTTTYRVVEGRPCRVSVLVRTYLRVIDRQERQTEYIRSLELDVFVYFNEFGHGINYKEPHNLEPSVQDAVRQAFGLETSQGILLCVDFKWHDLTLATGEVRKCQLPALLYLDMSAADYRRRKLQLLVGDGEK